jgi:ABC-2 type transport system ATP-binding protein
VGKPILEIRGLSKTYKGGVRALDSVDIDIHRGEIFALLGPNGAGKTTLIGAVCGLVKPTEGTIRAFGEDVKHHWRSARRRIGLVPQELAFDMFARVDHSVEYSRGMFGCPPSKTRIEEVLRRLVQQNIVFEGVDTSESSLEDIFVDLVENRIEVAA